MSDSRFPSSPQSEFEIGESAVRYYCRHMPAVFAHAVNAKVWDEEGRDYIDFLSACGSLNYGHNHPRIKARVIDYLVEDGILTSLDLHTVAKRAFLRTFRSVILGPRDLNYRVQFTGPTGTNAVEAALKLARKVTGRSAIVAFTNAFHGMTAGSQAVGGRQNDLAGTAPSTVLRLPYEGYAGAGTGELDRFETMVNDPSGGLQAPAAFIVETVQGEGGLNATSPEWLSHLAGVARRLGSLLIVDDVQAGCGRTGAFFSFESMGLCPDIVCLAKSIGGIGLPMALLLVKPECDQWAPGEHNGTFRGNNLAFVAATAALQLWTEPEFTTAVERSVLTVRKWIDETAMELSPVVAKPTGRGLLSGIRFTDPAIARHVAEVAVTKRLLVETSGPYGEVLKLLPPLTIEEDVLQEGLRRLKMAIRTVVDRTGLKSAA